MSADCPAASLARQLTVLLADGVREGVFPGAAAAVAWGEPAGRQQVTVSVGRCGGSGSQPVSSATCFDLASLTKPLATALVLLCLMKEGRVALDDSLPALLPDDIPTDKKGLTLSLLLGHASGLPAHRPYFEKLVKRPPEDRAAALRRYLLSEPLLSPPGHESLYSDLDFMLLGMIAEEAGGKRLDRLLAAVLGPLGLAEELFFQPLNAVHRQRSFAATEACPWRQRVLCGEVHDDNAHALGGVAGHAGLFGTAPGVLALCLHLLDVRQGRAVHPGYRAEDLRSFLSSRSVPGASWTLGFDTPSPAGSSAGRHFSSQSFGHLGFTGTSFWVDPERELAVVLLTNRVHPTRENDRIRGFRPRFHDAVAEHLGFR